MSVSLEVRDLVAGYGDTVVLDHISLSVKAGEGLALLGRNGVGKTTLLSAIFGLCTVHSGNIVLGEQSLVRIPIQQRSRLGLGLVPQEREVFKSLTVAQNLDVARLQNGWSQEQIYELFPRLAERRGNLADRLSGGEQQMLAIGRALAGNPSLLLLDEPLEGLAPIIVDGLLESLSRIRKETGLTMVIVEQKAELALSITERAIVLDRGRVRYEGSSAHLIGNEAEQSRLLSVSGENESPVGFH